MGLSAHKVHKAYNYNRLSVWGKKSEEREGKGGERACRQTFEAAIPPSFDYLAEHLSVRSFSVNQFRA